MPHEPKPLPTGNKLEDRQALHKYNKAHIKQSKQDNYNKRNVDRAREIAHEGTYTSGGRHLLGMKPVKGGFFTAEAPTTEKIPQKVGGPYSFAQTEINNLAWVIENKNLSDQERSMLESAKLQLQNRLELGLTQDQTWNNQIARNNMNAKTFFETGTSEKEPDLSNYENFAEFRRGANQDLTEPTTTTVDNTNNEDNNTTTIESDNKGDDKQVDMKIKSGYQRPTPTERRDKRLEDKLVEGRPLEQFRLNRERGTTGTPVNSLFHKDRKK